MIPPVPRVTRDGLLGRRLVYLQPETGYRVALEAPLLARFALTGRSRPFRSVLDLGAGPGAMVLMLVAMGWARLGIALEPDELHARLARENASENDCATRLEVIEANVRSALRRAPLDAELVITNPPYFDPDAGAVATGPSKARARALLDTTLAEFLRAARRHVGRGGRVVVAFPAARLVELLATASASGLQPKRLRLVHPRAGEEADVVFLEAKAGKPGGLVVEAPLHVRGAGEAYSPEVHAALHGMWPEPEKI